MENIGYTGTIVTAASEWHGYAALSPLARWRFLVTGWREFCRPMGISLADYVRG